MKWRPPGAPGARSALRRDAPCAGCWPTSPSEPRSARAAGRSRRVPEGRRQTETRWLRCGGGGIEAGQPVLVTADDLAIDQAGSHAQVADGLDHEREPLRPIVAPTGDKPDADRIAPRHKAVAVVLDLMNPVGAGRRTVGGRRQARLNETQYWHRGGERRTESNVAV